MQIKISPTDYERCYPSRLKKFFKSNLNYQTYDTFVPKSKRAVVGNVPSEIITLFGKENKAEKIKNFQSALADLSEYLRTSFYRYKYSRAEFEDFKHLLPVELKDFENNVSELFNKRVGDIMPQGYKFYVHYTDRGAFKNVFRLSLYDESFQKVMHDKALQVFFKPNIIYENLKCKHNNYAEANFWTFIKNFIGHRMDKSQFTRHYISDMKSAYALTEFADNSIYPTSSILPYSKYGIYCCDLGRFNAPIRGKLFDGGGFEKTKDFIEDKVTRKYFKKLVNANSEKDLQNRLNSIQKEIDNPKTPHRDKIIQALNLFKFWK